MSYIGQVGRQGQAASYTVTLPAVAANDVMFFFYTHTNTQVVTAITINGTNALSRFVSREQIVENALIVDVYTVTLTAGDSLGTLVVTQTGSSKSTISGVVLRGVDTTTPILTSANEHDTTAARTTPAITLPTTCDLISHIAERITSGANTSSTAPAGITKANDLYNVATGQNDSSTGYAVAVPAGTAGAYAWTVNGGAVTARRIGYTVAARPTGYVPPPNRTVRFGKPDGTETAVASIQYGTTTVASFTNT